MSYSFSVRGATVAEVTSKVSAELEKVVASQPVHKADQEPALKAAASFLGVLPAPTDKQELYVSVSGSVCWTGVSGTADCVLTSAGVNVSASLVAKES